MATYKITELVGTSTKSYADATESAVKKAQKSLRNLDWFEVVSLRGAFREDKIEYQVTLKLGFRLED